MNEPMHRKNKESFGMQTRAPYDDGTSKRGGDLYFKSGKDACISSNLKKKKKYLHILLNCYRKTFNEIAKWDLM